MSDNLKSDPLKVIDQDFCSWFCLNDPFCTTACRNDQDCPITANKLFRGINSLNPIKDKILGGTGEIITRNAEQFVAELVFATYAPWVIVLFVVVILLMVTEYIRPSIAITILLIGIIVAIIMAFISLALLEGSVKQLFDALSTQLKDNVNANKTSIFIDFFAGYNSAQSTIPCFGPPPSLHNS